MIHVASPLYSYAIPGTLPTLFLSLLFTTGWIALACIRISCFLLSIAVLYCDALASHPILVCCPALLSARMQIMTGQPSWAQRTITVTSPSRGCHVITREIERQMPELREFKVGMANIFLKHTSASITLNENVRDGMKLLASRCRFPNVSTGRRRGWRLALAAFRC